MTNTTAAQTATTVRDALAAGTARAMDDGHDFQTSVRLAVRAMAETHPGALAALAVTVLTD